MKGTQRKTFASLPTSTAVDSSMLYCEDIFKVLNNFMFKFESLLGLFSPFLFACSESGVEEDDDAFGAVRIHLDQFLQHHGRRALRLHHLTQG